MLNEACQRYPNGVVGLVFLSKCSERLREDGVRSRRGRRGKGKDGDRTMRVGRESAVRVLREEVRKRGSEVLVRYGDSVEAIVEVVKRLGIGCVYCEMGVEVEERKEEKRVEKRLSELGVGFEKRWGGVMYGWSQVGGVERLGEDADEFGRKVCKEEVENPLKALEKIPKVSRVVSLDVGEINGEIVGDSGGKGKRGGMEWVKGGERKALELVRQFVSGSLVATVSGGSSVGVIDTKFGSLAPFLTLGCLSPRWLWNEVSRKVPVNNVKRFCVEFELVLRDFLRYSTFKYGTHPA